MHPYIKSLMMLNLNSLEIGIFPGFASYFICIIFYYICESGNPKNFMHIFRRLTMLTGCKTSLLNNFHRLSLL